MGKRTPAADENVVALAARTITANGQATDWTPFRGRFNFSVGGVFTGTLALERSFDGGASALPVARDAAGTPATFSAPVSLELGEIEADVLWRVRATAWTSGAAAVRLSA